MNDPVRDDKKLADFKAQPPRVSVTKTPTHEGDRLATKALIDRYTDKDGFHCPKCDFVTTNMDEAVDHLAEEINKAFEKFAKGRE